MQLDSYLALLLNVLYSLWCCPIAASTAAGGRFRGSIGRALFKTTGVYQSVLEPDIATNKVRALLPFCPRSTAHCTMVIA